MKRILIIMLCLILSLSFFGCDTGGEDGDTTTPNDNNGSNTTTELR
jgi:hypothetical protein